MKRILFFGLALLAFTAIYGQETELKKERLTAQFEKQWTTPIVFNKSNFLEVTEGKANIYENHISSYAPMFFNTSVKSTKPRKVLLGPYQMRAFIMSHKKK